MARKSLRDKIQWLWLTKMFMINYNRHTDTHTHTHSLSLSLSLSLSSPHSLPMEGGNYQRINKITETKLSVCVCVCVRACVRVCVSVCVCGCVCVCGTAHSLCLESGHYEESGLMLNTPPPTHSHTLTHTHSVTH